MGTAIPRDEVESSAAAPQVGQRRALPGRLAYCRREHLQCSRGILCGKNLSFGLEIIQYWVYEYAKNYGEFLF